MEGSNNRKSSKGNAGEHFDISYCMLQKFGQLNKQTEKESKLSNYRYADIFLEICGLNTEQTYSYKRAKNKDRLLQEINRT